LTNGIIKSLQCQQKKRHNHSKSLAGRRDKGISSLIGIIFFLLIFTLALTYVFFWSQNTSNYADTVQTNINYQQQRAAEMLQVTTTSQGLGLSTINVTNPTPNVIIITQVWNSSHAMVWSGSDPIASFAYIILPSLVSSDGNLEVITSNGNVFYSTLQTPSGYWDVSFWAANQNNIILLGNTTWTELSFSRVYGNATTWGNQSYQTFGFNATTYIQPTINTTAITIYIGLISPNQSANNATILLENSTYAYPTYYYNGSPALFPNVNPSSRYFLQINYVDNATTVYPQTITVTIVGADFD